MQHKSAEIAGLFLFVGSVLCVLGIIIAEALYPGYSTSANYISDLGVGPSALIFNSSVFLLGVLTLCSAYFIQKTFAFLCRENGRQSATLHFVQIFDPSLY